MRIAFAGTPDFAVPALRALISSENRPICVLTQPDRPAGRGRVLQASPVKKCALEAGIPVLQPERLSGDAIQSELRELKPDLLVVVAYGLILPEAVLQIPTLGCWNIHASLLPRWRGAAPIQRAIESGDEQSGVSIMQMAAGLDTGPVFLKVKTPIASNETGSSLHDRLATMGAEALIACLEKLESRTLEAPREQDDSGASYASKLLKSEAEIDWHDSAESLERKVRAFNPWPVCWFMLGDDRLRVFKAEALQHDETSLPGKVLAASADGIDIATGDGVLRLHEIQRAGSRKMTAGDYLNAHRIQADS
jgi:methionyl-tRNA formyltransferase